MSNANLRSKLHDGRRRACILKITMSTIVVIELFSILNVAFMKRKLQEAFVFIVRCCFSDEPKQNQWRGLVDRKLA